MTHRLIMPLILVLGAAGCDAPEPIAPTPSPVPATPQQTPPPVSADTPFYVGRWAPTQSDCGENVWTFTRDRLEARQGACNFETITAIPAGFQIDAACQWDGKTVRPRMQLAYAQSAQALLMSDSPAGDVGLIACPARTP